MEPGEKIKKRKWNKPKTRNGCRTCKKRHVKCDEMRPSCHRCKSYGWRCEGYDDLRLGTQNRRAILPKDIELPPNIVSYAPVPLLMKSLNPGIRFQSQQERLYFSLFQDEIAAEMSGGFESVVWNRIVLQACADPSVRQVTIAIAALKKAARISGSVHGHEAQPHLEFALWEYGKALKGLQRAFSSGKRESNLRISLIASLLIFCFENMQGNIDRAFVTIQSALGLLPPQLLKDSKTIGKASTQTGLIPTSIPGIVEDEILGQFVSLDKPGVRLICPSIHLKIFPPRFHLQERQISGEFKTIDEARHYYELLRYGYPGYSGVVHMTNIPNACSDGPHRAARILTKMFELVALNDSAPGLMEGVQRWHQAFRTLWEHSRTTEGAELRLPALILRTQALSLDTSLGGFTTKSKTGHPDDDAIRELITSSSLRLTREILAITEEVVAHPNFSKSFVFDIGIIPSLWIAAVVPPHRDIREKALGLLRACEPRCENVWDSRTVADAAEAFLNSEVQEKG